MKRWGLDATGHISPKGSFNCTEVWTPFFSLNRTNVDAGWGLWEWSSRAFGRQGRLLKGRKGLCTEGICKEEGEQTAIPPFFSTPNCLIPYFMTLSPIHYISAFWGSHLSARPAIEWGLLMTGWNWLVWYWNYYWLLWHLATWQAWCPGFGRLGFLQSWESTSFFLQLPAFHTQHVYVHTHAHHWHGFKKQWADFYIPTNSQ